MPELDVSSVKWPEAAHLYLIPVMYSPGATAKHAATRNRWNSIIRKLPRFDTEIAEAALRDVIRDLEHVTLRRDKKTPKGVVAAGVFGWTLQQGVTLSEAAKAIGEIMRENGAKATSPTIIDQDRKEMWPAAHIWLAYLHTLGSFKPMAIPSDAKLLEILSLADALRRKAEVYTTGTQERPLFEPSFAWTFRLPAGVVLIPEDQFDLSAVHFTPEGDPRKN